MTQAVVHLLGIDDNRKRLLASTCAATGLVAAAFCAVIVFMMLRTFLRDRAANPLTAPAVANLKMKMATEGESDAVKEQIRKVDLSLRQEYFARRGLMERGGYLLLGGVFVLVLTVRTAATLRKTPPMPEGGSMSHSTVNRMAAVTRRAVSVAALVSAGALAAIAAMPTLPLPTVPKEEPAPAFVAIPPDVWEKNWPLFRGPAGIGLAGKTRIVEWDGASGKNILWKVPVPLAGSGSPIVWDDMLFVSGADAETREVFCFSTNDGSLKWRKSVGGPGAKPEVNPDAGFAAPTMACDGRRVFALFANGDLAAFDFTGKPLWSKNLGVPANPYGHASSPTVWRDRLIVQYDQGNSPSAGKSALFAFDCATGKQIWKTERAVAASWASPIIVQVNDKSQIITSANPMIASYDPSTGSELWRAKAMSGEVGPSPVFTGGVVLATNDRADLVGIRADGSGDVTKSHVLWKYADNLPDTVSPVCTCDLVFTVKTSGTIACVDIKDGKEVWIEDIAGNFQSSPVLVGDRLYLTDDKGTTYVLSPGRQYKLLATYKLGAGVRASPAFVGDRVYFRTTAKSADGKPQDHLICIGAKP